MRKCRYCVQMKAMNRNNRKGGINMDIDILVWFPIAAGVVIWFWFHNRQTQKDRDIAANSVIAVIAVELAAALVIYQGSIGFRCFFSVFIIFAWLVTALFSKEYMKNDTNVIRYHFFNLMTLGTTMGVFHAEDFFTLFCYFEMMSFTSFMWVAHRQTRESAYAAGTYLGIAIAGGMAILMGLFILYVQWGSLSFGSASSAVYGMINNSTELEQNKTMLYVAAGCLFVGFGVKAGAFPVHVWLPQSYTQAPAPATALLSAILSKTGILGIALVSDEIFGGNSGWGMTVVIVGVITMLVGGMRAVASSNFKTTIAYSSMSQIGFILFGIGMATMLNDVLDKMVALQTLTEEVVEAYLCAARGMILHMINHSLVKLVLFLLAGVVFLHVGSYELNKIRGFGRKKLFLMIAFGIAAAGVGGIPLFNGYVSKTLLHESIVIYGSLAGEQALVPYTQEIIYWIEILFLISGGLTVAYMTKLFAVLFLEKNQDESLQRTYEEKKQYMSLLSKIAMIVCLIPIVLIGVFPNGVGGAIMDFTWVQDAERTLYLASPAWNPHNLDMNAVNYFSLGNLQGAAISIAIGAVVYFLAVRLVMLRRKEKGYQEIFPAWLDMEKYLYRAVFYTAIPFVLGVLSRILDSLVDTIVIVLKKTVYRERKLPYELPEGNDITHKLGQSMENLNKLSCIIKKKKYEPKGYEHKLALMNVDFVENLRIIERSLSFGLFMFCVGLGLTMIYLLIVN